MKGTLYIVLRPNLGGDSIFSLPWSTRERSTPHPPPTCGCTHSDDSTGDREFDSNVSYFLIFIKACSIFVFTHFPWFFCPFTPVGDKWEDEYSSFKPNSSRVHPTNLQFVPLPMMDFEYINSLPPIHYGPFRPKVGIMAHLVVSDLLICSLNFKELTHT